MTGCRSPELRVPSLRKNRRSKPYFSPKHFFHRKYFFLLLPMAMKSDCYEIFEKTALMTA